MGGKKIFVAIAFLSLALLFFTQKAGADSLKLAQSDSVPSSLEDPLQISSTEPAKIVMEIIGKIIEIVYASVIGLAIIFLIIGGILYMLSSGNEKRLETAKKMIVYSLVGVAIAIGAAVIMKEIATALGGEIDGAFEPIPGVTENVLEAKTILEKFINLLLALLSFLGIIGIVIGGLWYLNSGGDEDKATIGRKTLIYSIIGLFVAVGSMIIVKQIANLFQ